MQPQDPGSKKRNPGHPRQAILESTDEPTQELLLKTASSFVPDERVFRSCLDSQKYKAAVQKDLIDAADLKIYGTPAFVLALTGYEKLDGIQVVGAQSFLDLRSKLDQLLEHTPKE